MQIISIQFFIFILISLIAYYLIDSREYRRAIFSIVNAVFLFSYTSFDLLALVPLLVFLLVGYVEILLIRRYRNRYLLFLFIAVVIFLFIYIRRFDFIQFLPVLPFVYEVVGTSYILFRILHLLIDHYEGIFESDLSIVVYFNYTVSFLTLLSGPIQRLPDYLDQVDVESLPEFDRRYVLDAVHRICIGLFKIIVFSSAFEILIKTYGVENYLHFSNFHTLIFWIWFGFHGLFYLIYLYFNFSGYTDLVIGFGKFFGFVLPENFNAPFKSKNFLDFWTRWHMTLANWFKRYLFNPLLKTMMRRWALPDYAPFLGVIAYFITFLVLGLWHGQTLAYVCFGLFIGFGTSINQLYQILMRKRLGKAKYKQIGSTGIYTFLARGLTLSYVGVSIINMSWDTPDIYFEVMKSMGLIGCIASVMIMTIFLAVCIWFIEWLVSKIETVKNLSLSLLNNPNVYIAYLAIMIFILTIAAFFQGGTNSQFVYSIF